MASAASSDLDCTLSLAKMEDINHLADFALGRRAH
jgi:hypothetical protein